ncbi:GANP/Nin1/mts3/eIF-3 p25 family protein [Mollisia scopiformis]|uniref:GANP/Nin1/mts3/eIF-3 p25 family protein n=1 Tax=Mollisia scopiformis TaxID=149040 RepID=A0A194X8U3_MOLSC|nr:GANP/Nin1/mts3/eIF-3 p25 family protein [Mollisia scopiformis]KUJ16591.1 GANP/Nin1/mts3/eIF-3 p25 family protein [Mollisia scopiformis]
MYSTMNPWAQQPPPPGTQGQYGYQQREHKAPPAYHSVQVRQSFNAPPLHYVPVVQQPFPPPPPPTMAPVQAAPPRKKIDWPQPVRNYVSRSFEPKALLDDVSRPDMEAKLKQTITDATDNNTLDTLDWDNLPLPQQMIRQERAQTWQQESVDLRMGGLGLINSKKRKSQELGDEDSNATPPWRTNNRIEDRITYDPSQCAFQDDSHKNTSKFQKNLEKRQKRFDTGYKSYKKSPSPEPTAGPVVGTYEVLEKKYFRLTSAPIPSQVRPEHVLRKTLELLKKKWRSENNYSYICDQFKSMRQDLTVQRIRNEFTVTVYEIHARIALEKADLGEYNQCQTQLRALYAQNLGGNPVEFKAYRILYFIHTSNRTALNDVLADLTTAEKEEKAIKHALGVRSALALGNYHRFFRLYLETPNMGAYLMDMFVVRERLAALANICRSYKPDVSIRFIAEELGFESDHQAGQFIVDYNGQDLLEEKGTELRFLAGKGFALFEAARNNAFRKVDIKGQI